MNPVLALIAHSLEMELPVLIPLLEHEASDRVLTTLRDHWGRTEAEIVHRVNVRDGITLDANKTVIEKDGRPWTHREAFLRRCAYWLYRKLDLPFPGPAADFVRDLETRDLLATVLPKLTPATTPEEAYGFVVDYQLTELARFVP